MQRALAAYRWPLVLALHALRAPSSTVCRASYARCAAASYHEVSYRPGSIDTVTRVLNAKSANWLLMHSYCSSYHCLRYSYQIFGHRYVCFDWMLLRERRVRSPRRAARLAARLTRFEGAAPQTLRPAFSGELQPVGDTHTHAHTRGPAGIWLQFGVSILHFPQYWGSRSM